MTCQIGMMNLLICTGIPLEPTCLNSIGGTVQYMSVVSSQALVVGYFSLNDPDFDVGPGVPVYYQVFILLTWEF